MLINNGWLTWVDNSITRLAIAAQLSRNHDITVVAKNLPGDDPTTEWTSP
jgi:DeoR/GlpR family transcriptional regulator of sugar metabolism